MLVRDKYGRIVVAAYEGDANEARELLPCEDCETGELNLDSFSLHVDDDAQQNTTTH